MKVKRLALYCRVSTDEQTVDPQLDALHAYAQARGFEAVEYVDHGVSGAKDRRPALDRLLADARARRIDAVAAVKLDRLARSVHHLTTFARELEALGVDLIVVDQQIDTSTPSGRFLFHTLGAVAELERDLIRERVSAGMKAAKRRGKHVGRRPVDVNRLALIRGIRAGTSISALARELGVSRPTVRKLIAEEVEKRVSGEAPKTPATTRGESRP